ncbi:hypothetical protein PIB30_012126 [Stylosanthes scabra]|uniref:Pectinesterase inhibitor domain-containing protein n=1 Tax=Stylosanthes scabra TaxID=79078 RepID=A0ABU6S6K9_9FABA|nr:hypothetical protein [Stylosanthes scabra]
MVCEKTSNYTFCVESLYSDHHTPNADPYALAYVAFRLAYRNATSTRDYIAELLNNASCSSCHHHKILVRCEDDYKEAVSAIEKGYKDLNSQTYLELDYLAGVASDDAEDCQDSFQGKTGYHYYSMIEFMNKDFKGLCQICVAISKLLA